jgi:PD-(D/E)XK nuclease superfamily
MSQHKYTWSYSSLGMFLQCPHKYYRVRIARDVVEPPTEAINYGLMVHRAAEDYIRDGVDLPPKLEYIRPTLDKLLSYPGEKYCEYKMALTRTFEPCAFDSPDAWWRGIADLLIIDGNRARILDYKTGKSAKFADTKQLELLSLATFKHFPQVIYTKCALLFVVSQEMVKANFVVSDTNKYWEKWIRDTSLLEQSFEAQTWNPKPNFSCRKWCSVYDCIHNGRS